MVRHLCVLNRICARVLIHAHPRQNGGASLAPTETGKPILTFQATKLLELHPEANTLTQRRMMLSPAVKKELTRGLPLSIPLEIGYSCLQKEATQVFLGLSKHFLFAVTSRAHSLCPPSLFPYQA